MTDTLKIINCPSCGEEMTKIFIPEKGINVDVCDKKCGGIFFDNQEINEFSGKNDDISEIKSLLKNKNFLTNNENEIRICPVCGTKMVQPTISGVKIDTCYKCGGIFLDNGEFEKIRTKFKKHVKTVPVQTPDVQDLTEIYKDYTSLYDDNKKRYLGIYEALSNFLSFMN